MIPTSQPGDLGRLFHPSSICIIGASGNATSVSAQPLRILTSHSFPGRITLVNPRHPEISGIECYPDVNSVPEVPDVALIVVPASAVPKALAECGRKGVTNAIVLSAGFEETESGKGLAAEVARLVRAFGINLVGPNSLGLWNIPGRTFLTHASAAQRDEFIEGPVTIVSQSGSIGAAIVGALQELGVGCRYMVSAGNETGLTVSDFIDYAVSEGKTRVVALFLEGVRDGQRFMQALRSARAAGIHIVVLKGGNSDAGRAATATHTGKMASSGAIYSGILRQCGSIQAANLDDLVAAVATLASCPIPPRTGSGQGVAVVSASGGSRALLVDDLQAFGVPLAQLLPKTEQALLELSGGDGHMHNPIDLPLSILYDLERFGKAIELVVDDPNVSSVLVQYASRGPNQVEDHANFFREATVSSDKPIVVSLLLNNVNTKVERALLLSGVLVTNSPSAATRAIRWLYEAQAEEVIDVDQAFGETTVSTDPLQVSSWEDQVSLLAAAGIAMPAWRRLGPVEHIGDVLRALCMPVAVKALPQDASHKGDLGLVEIDLRTTAEVSSAVTRLRQSLGPSADVLVQEMAPTGVEVLLAVRNDPDFGTIVAIGSGGFLVEWLQDVAYLGTPCVSSDIRKAIQSLRLRTLLSGIRGRPAADEPALVRAALALVKTFNTCSTFLNEIEVNPLVVLERGKGAVAVDILTR